MKTLKQPKIYIFLVSYKVSYHFHEVLVSYQYQDFRPLKYRYRISIGIIGPVQYQYCIGIEISVLNGISIKSIQKKVVSKGSAIYQRTPYRSILETPFCTRSWKWGVPKVCNIKMSHNAIPTIPLYQRTPYNQQLRVQSELGDTFLCLKLEVRVEAQKS